MFYVADYVLAYRLSNFSCTVLTVDGCVSINHRPVSYTHLTLPTILRV